LIQKGNWKANKARDNRSAQELLDENNLGKKELKGVLVQKLLDLLVNKRAQGTLGSFLYQKIKQLLYQNPLQLFLSKVVFFKELKLSDYLLFC
jgi:hypothetical protein